jgi:hypothetical protein
MCAIDTEHLCIAAAATVCVGACYEIATLSSVVSATEATPVFPTDWNNHQDSSHYIVPTLWERHTISAVTALLLVYDSLAFVIYYVAKRQRRTRPSTMPTPIAPTSVLYTLLQFLRAMLWLWICVTTFHIAQTTCNTATTATAQQHCSGKRLRKVKGKKREVPCNRSSRDDELTECNVGDGIYSLCTHCLPRLGRLQCGHKTDTDGPTGELTAHGCYAASSLFIRQFQRFVKYIFTDDRVYWTVAAFIAMRSLHFITVAVTFSFIQTIRQLSPQWIKWYSSVTLVALKTLTSFHG